MTFVDLIRFLEIKILQENSNDHDFIYKPCEVQLV